MNMSRIAGVFATLALLSACGAPAAPKATEAAAPSTSKLPDLGGKEVVIALENAYLPFNFVPKDSDKGQGWDYDVLNELGTRLNFKPVFKQFAWDNMISAVSSGQFDMAADGISITEERAKIVDYSIPYINVDQRMLVKSDSPLKNVSDIKKDGTHKIAAQKGTTNFDESVKLIGEKNVIGFDTYDLAVQAGISGDVDAVNIDDVAGQGYVGANAEKIRLLDGKLTGGGLGFIYAKGSPLRDQIDLGLKAMVADGTLEKFNAKWFSAAFAKSGVTYDTIKPGATVEPTKSP